MPFSKFVKRAVNCDETPEYNYSDCIINQLNANDKLYKQCHVNQINCTASALRTKENDFMLRTKSMSHQELFDKTGCKLPCNHMFYEIKPWYDMNMESVRSLDSYNMDGAIQIKLLLEGPFKVHEEGTTYGISNAFTDLGGTIGFYLGMERLQ